MTRVDFVGSLDLDASMYDGLIEHAKSDAPFEVCGLLAGRDGAVSKAYRVDNAERSMTNYNMDSKALLHAMRDIEDRELELQGIYHSHTHTEAYPSATDIRLAFDPNVAYVIVSLQDPDQPVIRAFDIRDESVTERVVTRDGEEVPTGPR